MAVKPNRSSRVRFKNRQTLKNTEESKRVQFLDQLAEYQSFIRDLPKELRNALLDGKPADAIYKKYENVAAVRAVQIMMTEPDSGKALAAVKDVLDRTQGKAIERKLVKHHLEELPDKELDAIIMSELNEVNNEPGEE